MFQTLSDEHGLEMSLDFSMMQTFIPVDVVSAQSWCRLPKASDILKGFIPVNLNKNPPRDV